MKKAGPAWHSWGSPICQRREREELGLSLVLPLPILGGATVGKRTLVSGPQFSHLGMNPAHSVSLSSSHVRFLSDRSYFGSEISTQEPRS